MKQITIKNESTSGFNGDFNESGFTISFCDEEEEATIFDLSEDFCSKLISKDGLDDFWNKLMKVDFQKVLAENEQYQGCDGSYSIVELSVGLQSLKLELWEPNTEFYEENHMSESIKLIELVHDIMDFAAENDVATDFEF